MKTLVDTSKEEQKKASMVLLSRENSYSSSFNL